MTLIVAPAVTARMLGRSLNAMFAIAVAWPDGRRGWSSSVTAGLPTGPTVALLAVAQGRRVEVALWACPPERCGEA